ncbi:ribonucleoside-diphosphate reductase, adenosylcobalamin-dependent [Micromonospora sp. ATCC 39149]|uniref:Vitamin B12-dependent ribonucleotide reductase n=1 Tax=Micromonospora carbonacea TaxID=47853 RepID=A0A7D6C9I7_9ACTN|nr:adenosylcobalamin-dependent ribonucleoside-diphosphate reductase [Micromonospora sp. ATCC 39149]EEP70436.1 ribonucleoside-diphosphate reductase, adenosylcobalamin-dependent [Micromonospora sp. ATCC 39149]QLJ96842.1 adenosylcobalamin-dependent ribonucleoside-diphosphate reductase [Micromonospora carbonacea]
MSDGATVPGAPDVLRAKLGRRVTGPDGAVRIESVDDLLDRVATGLGAVEREYGADESTARVWAARFRALMAENRFWPSGRILNNCGTRQGQLASCFVLPVEDDLGAIFDTLKLAASCHRTGGGTGFDLTPLRERGAPISTAEAAGSSGPVSWLHLFDAETGVVMQGGKMRGANLASLSVRHPDVFEFIDAKAVVGRLANFNLSVTVDDAFMRTLIDGGEIDLVSPVGGRPRRRVPAAEIWRRISAQAWRTGDPGLLFTDMINRANPLLDRLGPIRTTNPCGEQTLYPYEPSTLGSVNLRAMTGPDGRLDTARLERTVEDAVRLLDNSIDASHYPDPRITAMARGNRRLGLGVMGFADLLIALGVRYDSTRALAVVDEVGGRIRAVAEATTRRLAAERGTFPNFDPARFDAPVRNCAVTTIAPTGTISMVAGCSSGIEPRFAPIWRKNVLVDGGVSYVDEDLAADVCAHGGVDPEQARRLIRERPVTELPMPEPVRDRYRYAHDVPGEWHVRIAAQWQRHIDNAVSKTVNLPRDCSVDDVAEVLTASWRLGCKGVSVYRQGSREQDLQEVAGARTGTDRPTPLAGDAGTGIDTGTGAVPQSRALLAATEGAL